MRAATCGAVLALATTALAGCTESAPTAPVTVTHTATVTVTEPAPTQPTTTVTVTQPPQPTVPPVIEGG